MSKRFLTVFAAMALSGVSVSAASAQGYHPSSPGYVAAPAPYQGAAQGQPRSLAMPDFDALDDEQDDRRGRPMTGLPTPGPVMSPDDPRYGRPMTQQGYAQPAPYQQPQQGYQQPQQGYQQPPQQAYGQPRPQEGIGGSQGAGPSDGRPMTIAGLPPEDQPEVGESQLPPHLRRQEVDYATKEAAGTIIVDTANTYLYLVLGNGRAMRYGVRVGRDGFTWSGAQKVSRKAEWPDWHPPTEMIERQPYLPRFMAGGPGNPMGARAMYLGSTLYRIHGTNQPSTIGKFVSSGCIGLLNDDVADLYDRVKVGAKVVVIQGSPRANTTASAQPQAPMPGTQPTTIQPLPTPVTIR